MKTKAILTLGAVLVLLVMSNVSAQLPGNDLHCSMQAWLARVSPCLSKQTMCDIDCDMDWNSGYGDDPVGYQSCISGCQSQYDQCSIGCGYGYIGITGESISVWDLFMN